MNYSPHQIDGIKQFIADISAKDLMHSQELINALVSVLAKKLDVEIQPSYKQTSNESIAKDAINMAIEVCGIDSDAFYGRSTIMLPVYARRIVTWYLDKYTSMTHSELARTIKKHRTTVLFSLNGMDDEYKFNRDFKIYMDRFCEKMNIKHES